MNAVALSDSERRQIVAALAALTQRSDSPARRQPRHCVEQLMWLKRLPQPDHPRGGSFKIRTQDVSSKGIGFLARRPFQPDEWVVIPLQFQEGGGMLVLCRIRFCTPQSEGGYRVGAYFEKTLPDPTGQARIPSEWLKLAWGEPAAAEGKK